MCLLIALKNSNTAVLRNGVYSYSFFQFQYNAIPK